MAGEIRRTIRFSEDTWKLIEAEMQATGLTMTAVVDAAVKAHLQTDRQNNDRYEELAVRIAAIEQHLGITRQ